MIQGRVNLDLLDKHASYRPSHIVGGIYQGADPPLGGLLHHAGVNALVLVAFGCQHDPLLFPGVSVVQAPGDDTDCNHIDPAQLAAWKNAAKIAAQLAEQGHTVLITCQMGWNRSALVTAMAVRYLTGWSGDRAVTLVKAARPVAFKSNVTFERFARALPSIQRRTHAEAR